MTSVPSAIALGNPFLCLAPAMEGGAALMRTAEIMIVDELRVFHQDMLGELVDRMASYGGAGRLITASSAGYEDECRTTTELEKSDSRRWFLRCPSCGRENIAQWANVQYKNRRAPIYVMPCCGGALDRVGRGCRLDGSSRGGEVAGVEEKTALQAAFGTSAAELAGPSLYGGAPPTWKEIGGFDIAGGAVIEATDKLIEGFESVATATGFTVLWTTMMDLAGGLDNEVMQIVAYDEDGRATQIDRFAVPVPNATDASTIAGQERRLLQTLLQARERAAGTGGVRKHDEGEGVGDELRVPGRPGPAYRRDPRARRMARAGRRGECAAPRGILVGLEPSRRWYPIRGNKQGYYFP